MNELETVLVSRKTPRDGRLEISSATADALGGAGAELPVRVDSRRARGTVVTMPCGCKGEMKHTVHVFLQSELFRDLAPDSTILLALEPSPSIPEVVITRVTDGK